jgi:hypothetical protein
MLRYIETRLKELEEEKEELKAYGELDSERRALEYTLYTKELQSTNETLKSVRCFALPLHLLAPLRHGSSADTSIVLFVASTAVGPTEGRVLAGQEGIPKRSARAQGPQGQGEGAEGRRN